MVDNSENEGTPVLGEDRVTVRPAVDNPRSSNDVDVVENTPGSDLSVNGAAHAGESGRDTDVVNALDLYDKTSHVSAVVTDFPATIGNADDCDLAIKGPGPEGVYARIRSERNVFIAQLANADVTFSVNDRPLQSVILMDGDVLALGDHEVRVRFTHVEPPQPVDDKPRRSRRRLIAGLGGVVFVLVLIWIFGAMSGSGRPSSATAHKIQPESASRSADERQVAAGQSRPIVATRRADRDRDVMAAHGEPTRSPSSPAAPEQAESEPVSGPQSVSSVQARDRGSYADAELLPEASVDDESSRVGAVADVGTAAQSAPDASTSEDVEQPVHGKPHRSRSRVARAQAEVRKRRSITSEVLQRMRESYAKGDVVTAEDMLRSAPSGADADRLAHASVALDRARRAFRLAQQAAAAGRLDELATRRQALVRAEHELGMKTASRRLREIDDLVVARYRRAAQRAIARDVQAQAYGWYQRVLAIRPGDPVAQAALKRISDHARRWYLQGYKLEYRALKTAIECWRRVINILPSGTHWHQLAQAKLYEYRDFEAL